MLDIQKHVDMQVRHTLAAPSVARYFARCENETSIQAVCAWAKENGLPVRVLGEGSNVLLAEALPVLVLQPALKAFDVTPMEDETVNIWCGAGENWHALVERCVDQGYYGIENLALIPGSVGAAPIQNIGAYGVEFESVFECLECFDMHNQVFCTFDKTGCHFAYRDSIFKSGEQHRYIITRVCLKLSTVFNPILQYAPLNTLSDQVSLTARMVFDTVCATRLSKLPDPKHLPNAGSFFKNPVISANQYLELKKRYPDLPNYPVEQSDNVKVPAAWLIDQLGWKSKAHRGVCVHDRQALVLCNPERRPLSDILVFSSAIQADVQQRFGIVLEREPQPLF